MQNTNIATRKIADLTLYEGNAKQHPRKQIELLRQSIKEFGWTVPVLIDGDDVVIAGHGRIEAAMGLGIDEVPTISLAHLTEDQARAYRLADNRLTEIGEYDHDLLAEELQALSDADFDLSVTGFSQADLEQLIKDTDDQIDGEADGAAMPIYEVLVQCNSEEEQEKAFQLLTAEGFQCRVQTF